MQKLSTTRPALKNYLPQKIMPRHDSPLFLLQLTQHSHSMRLGFWWLDPWHNKGQSQEKFLDCADGATSLSGGEVSVATQNQAECKQAARKQASARERTSATVCRTPSADADADAAAAALLPHKNVLEMRREARR
jgi:hypothetical protein